MQLFRMARSNRFVKQFLCPLQYVMTDGVAVGHSVSLIHVAHVTGIIHHNLRLHGLPLSIAEITCCGAIVNISQNVCVAFCPSTVLL